MSRCCRTGSLSVWLLMARIALAQELKPEPIITVDIVGTAPVGGSDLDSNVLPYTVQTATSKTMKVAQAESVVDYLTRNVNGVNMNDIAGSPFQADVTFRGFRASPVLGTAQGIAVYLDGVRINEPLGDVVNWDMLPEGAVSKVLLVGGSNPLYGLNSLGGALAITTKSGHSHPGTELELSTTSAGRRKLELSVGARPGHGWHSFVSATVFDDRGWRDQSPGRVANVFVKIGRRDGPLEWNWTALAGRSRLSGNGLLPSYRWSGDGYHAGLYEQGSSAVYTYPDNSENTLGQTALNIRRDLGGGTRLSVHAYLRGSRRDTLNGDISDDYLGELAQCAAGPCGEISPAATMNKTSTQQHGSGVSIHLSGIRGEHQLSAGATFDRNAVRFSQFEQAALFSPQRGVIAAADAEPELSAAVSGSARMAGLFGSDSWAMRGDSVLTASARLNWTAVTNTLAQQATERFRYLHLNPSLGVVHRLSPTLTAFASVAQNNRVPTVIELGCADRDRACRLPVGLQSDPFLKQVVSTTGEAGLRWRGHDTTMSASVFRTSNRDDILFQSAGHSTGYFANVDRTRHQGAEVSASGSAGPLSMRLGYSFLEATYDAPALLFTGARNVLASKGTPIAGLPRHTLKLGADWDITPAWAAGADAQLQSSLPTRGNEDGLRNDRADGQAQERADWSIRGYAILNLRSSYRVGNCELSARITNAFDRRYENYGAVGGDAFPDGQLLKPRDGMAPVALARFVAPGAPRSFGLTARFRY